MSEERNQAIGKNIKKVLQANGVKQKDLATELGVSASAMSAYTTGKTSVPAWLIADIAERFHVSTDSLLESGSQFDENSSENYSAKTVFDCLLTLLIAFTGNLEIVKVPVNKTRFVDDRFVKKEEEFNALLIKDDYIDWILQRWELY